MSGPTTAELMEIGRRAGLAEVGVAPAGTLEPARTILHHRKKVGLAGDMQFTYRNPDRSTDPGRSVPGARSLVAGAWSYGRWRKPEAEPGTGPYGAVARYSWHEHYGDLERALQPIADRLTGAGYRARVIADTNALVDRNVAWSAGIGWYGKNTNLLLPGQGSWFVLGAVVTDAPLEPTGPPLEDGCGSCNQCIDDCPTDAIIAPGVVDATRCLAWIVQAGGSIPPAYREAIGDRLYGCDDCQDVCPPNRSAAREDNEGPMAELERTMVDLRWLLNASDEDIAARHGRWYIAERNMDFVRRTALVVLGNTADPAPNPTDDDEGDEVAEILTRYLTSPVPLLRGHAVWAARRLGRTDLLPDMNQEPDPAVRAEWSVPVTVRTRPSTNTSTATSISADGPDMLEGER